MLAVLANDFWKIKRVLAPTCNTVPHCIVDNFGNEITDEGSICEEYRREFIPRLRKHEIEDDLKDYELLNNALCKTILQNAKSNISSEFTLQELGDVLKELKRGKCMDPAGFIREMFINGGQMLTQSLLAMANSIKNKASTPLQWNQMYIQTLKKKNGSVRKLSNYRGISLVPIISIIFEQLLKSRVTPLLEETMSKFQTGDVKNKGVVDNLFLLRGLIDHSKYLKKELWITFYKCFDSLWLEVCINSLWWCGIDDDILYLIYLLNRKANVIVRTPFGNTQSFEICNLVKQGTVPGPILNNCSLDDICSEGHGHNMDTVEIKTLEFVDDIADPNNGYFEALKSNQTISFIQKRKRLTFSAEKCKILKINSTDNSSSLFLSGIKLEADPQFRYLGDIFNNKGSNSSLCEDRAQKVTGSSNEIISLCKESILENTQISDMILLYHTVFIPRLIYSCESWSNLSSENYAMLQKSQLTLLRRVMELPRSVPTDALFLEMGIWPI